MNSSDQRSHSPAGRFAIELKLPDMDIDPNLIGLPAGLPAAEAAAQFHAPQKNSKVQVYNGDVASLSYNYVGMSVDKDGGTEPNRAKSTRVYV